MLGKLFSHCQGEAKSSPNHSPVDLGRVPTITIVPAPPIPLDNGKLRLQNMDHLEAGRNEENIEPHDVLSQSYQAIYILAFCISSLQVDKEILRGISLPASLLQGGKLWRKSPLDMSEQDSNFGFQR